MLSATSHIELEFLTSFLNMSKCKIAVPEVPVTLDMSCRRTELQRSIHKVENNCLEKAVARNL